MSQLPVLRIAKTTAEAWSDGESYYQTLFATYCTSYCCGVNAQHLNADVYPIIVSVMRFHLYFTVRRIVRRIQCGESMGAISREFGASGFYGKIETVPRNEYWTKTVTLSDGTMGEKTFHSLMSNYKEDYRKYIPRRSDGLKGTFTNVGLQYLNQSIEAYIYCVLGAQANTRVSIVSHGGGSLEAQQVFRRLMEDSVINYSFGTWILNMNKAIQDTNVVQNLAISPSLWLIPSKMVILKKPIPRYNNMLRTATDSGMKFGVNLSLNYKRTTSHPTERVTRKREPPPRRFRAPENHTTAHPTAKPTSEKPASRVSERNTDPTGDFSLLAIGVVALGVGYVVARTRYMG